MFRLKDTVLQSWENEVTAAWSGSTFRESLRLAAVRLRLFAVPLEQRTRIAKEVQRSRKNSKNDYYTGNGFGLNNMMINTGAGRGGGGGASTSIRGAEVGVLAAASARGGAGNGVRGSGVAMSPGLGGPLGGGTSVPAGGAAAAMAGRGGRDSKHNIGNLSASSKHSTSGSGAFATVRTRIIAEGVVGKKQTDTPFARVDDPELAKQAAAAEAERRQKLFDAVKSKIEVEKAENQNKLLA
eukprot:GSA25T00016580001.1